MDDRDETIADLRRLCRELMHVNAYECDGCDRAKGALLDRGFPACGPNCELFLEALRLGVAFAE